MRQAVKSRRLFARLLALAVLLVSASAAGQGSLFGSSGPPRRSPVELDPWLPTGAELPARVPRPDSSEPAGCSFRAPVCVHRGPGVPAVVARRALQALETAYQRLVWAMRLPAPRDDSGGGGPELDLYLRAGGKPQIVVEHDAPATTRFDRASAFCVLSAAERALAERAASLCVGEAIAWGLDASATPHVKRAYATHLWLIAGHPTAHDVEAIDDLQANPQLALVTRERSKLSEGAAIWFEHLDASLGRAHAGVLATALIAAGGEKTAPQLWQWDNEPDVLDVLRHTVGGDPRSMAEVMGDFAVSRAFLGDRDDAAHVPTLDFAGAFGRVRFDWVIPFSSLPRRVAPARPIEPTGAMYVWLALDRVPEGASLGFRAEWEPPVAFRWTLVKVAADGRELSRVHAAFQERGTQVEQTLVELEGAAGILVVGVNLGGVDLKHPFDPDVAPFEPHVATVYLARL